MKFISSEVAYKKWMQAENCYGKNSDAAYEAEETFHAALEREEHDSANAADFRD
jgi:hypothetical protein